MISKACGVSPSQDDLLTALYQVSHEGKSRL